MAKVTPFASNVNRQDIIFSVEQSCDIRAKIAKPRENQLCLRTAVVFLVLTIALAAATILTVSILMRTYHERERIDTSTTKHNNDVAGTKVAQSSPLTLDDMFDNRLNPKLFPMQWASSGDVVFYRNAAGDLVRRDLASNSTSTVLTNATMSRFNSSVWSVSPDLNFVMLRYDMSSITTQGNPFRAKIYDIKANGGSGQFINFPNDDPRNWPNKLSFANWAGTGSAVSFVYNEDLYYQTAATESNIVRFTQDGQKNVIRNGMNYWHTSFTSGWQAHAWSADMQHLLYLKLNASRVGVYQQPRYGPPEDYYGSTDEFPYTKTGDVRAHTQASLYVAAVNQPSAPRLISPPSELTNRDHYIRSLIWRDSQHFIAEWLNRVQNFSIITICNAATGNCVKNLQESAPNGWIDVYYRAVRFVNNGASYLTTLPKDEGSSGKWRQIALVTSPVDGAGTVTFLTSGQQEVERVLGFDEERNLVYYYGNGGPDDDHNRYVFRVGTPAAAPADRPRVCVSCDVGPGCSFAVGMFSASGKFYSLNCQGPDLPHQRLRSTDGTTDFVLENNDDVRARLMQKDLPEVVFRKVKVGAFEGRAKIFLPRNRQPGEKFPLFVYPYGGPGSQYALNQFQWFGSPWTKYNIHLASSEKIVAMRFDQRGSGGKGYDFLFTTHRKMGSVEVDDYITAARNISKELDFIDGSKIAIFGWSYGGFVSGSVMGRNSSLIKCGIIGAPVVDWRYYYSGYTERYNGIASDEDNLLSYEASNILNAVENMRNKELFIIHGTADDNVHFQNSMHLTRALSVAQIPFKFGVYVDMHHGVLSTLQRRHMFMSMNQFLHDNCKF